MRTIAIINQKGGCGKTTTAINLGACLGRRGLRTLLVDLDPQSHCAAGLGIPHSRIDLDTSDLLMGGGRGVDPGRLFWRACRNLDVIASRVRLAGLEAPGSAFARRERREEALAEELRHLAPRFDVCLLDCPPSIGVVTYNALVAADLVLVPVETGYFSLQGASRQLATVRALSRRLQTDIRCVVLPTLHEAGVAVAEDLLEELRQRFGRRLLPVVVHRDTSLREAASFGRPVCEHAPESRGAMDYAQVAIAIVESEELRGVGAEEDWSDLDEHADRPVDRPAFPKPAGGPALPAFIGSGFGGQVVISGPLDLGLATSQPMAGVGGVVVTLSGGDLPTGLTQRVHETREPSPTRAQDIARRAAQLRMTTALPSIPVASPRPLPTPARRPYGAHPTLEGVLFVQPGPLGRRVCVAGSFTDWQPIPMTLVEATGAHELCLGLPQGRHEYRLQVDGHWIADPYNTDWVLNGLGEPHSIIEVPSSEAPCAADDLCSGAD
ncbi:MAG: AAA family ATPase [Phycisphaerales bacterium]|nr:AAA family ATPase [Phycisphaerales bacterium]